MDERYLQPEIAEIWSNANKLALWQKSELVMLEARSKRGEIPEKIFLEIKTILLENPIREDKWKSLDKELRHDLNAFIEERTEFLPENLAAFFHEGLTSYDTQEPAFGNMIRQSLKLVRKELNILLSRIDTMARKHRMTIMLSRTHGQGAELQSFGKRNLSWYADLCLGRRFLKSTEEFLDFSKMSGAVGNNPNIDPETERVALELLGFEPYYGATQIMPREAYFPAASALYQIVATVDKIALSIRLGARSGRAIMQEPFGKTQMGSSAMPHKRNTIVTEQLEGMARLAEGFLLAIARNICTWEERAIEQSCVERVAWPDLFHVTLHSLRRLTKVISGLVVHDNVMLQEVVESHGCYASSEAKDFLKHRFAEKGLRPKDAYRVIQLAAFNADAASRKCMSSQIHSGLTMVWTDSILESAQRVRPPVNRSIMDIIAEGRLEVSNDLAVDEETVNGWNEILLNIFSSEDIQSKWKKIFQPSHLLRNEEVIFKKVLEQ